MDKEIYKSPNTDSEVLIPVKRNGFARIFFWIVWLLIIDFLIRITIGGIVGTTSSSQVTTAMETRSIIISFFESYRLLIISGEILIWFAFCYTGYLPGTSKSKYVNRLELEKLSICPPTDVSFERTDDVNENIRRYKKALQERIESIKKGKNLSS